MITRENLKTFRYVSFRLKGQSANTALSYCNVRYRICKHSQHLSTRVSHHKPRVSSHNIYPFKNIQTLHKICRGFVK